VVDEATREVVGSCAFKTPPADDGSVEIAYFTYPGFEGRGYATAMASKLIDLASRSAAVRQIVAHTLPETNASTRVLEKVGMTFAGEVMDPHDGRVWRWQVQTGG
jgi:RimJ/RimL family protein N-acetyltransferase